MYRHIEMMATALEQMRRDSARIADSLEQIATALKHPPRPEAKESIQDFVDKLEREGLPKPSWVGLIGAAPGIDLFGDGKRWEDQADGLGEEPEDGKKAQDQTADRS